MSTARTKKEEIILLAKGVVNSFGKQVVHKNVNLDVRRGEILGIVGGSGSGKSVLLRTIAGLHNPNKGEVLINGKPVNGITSSESAALLGMLFQEGALFSSMTIEQNIMFPLREYTELNEEERAEIARLKLAMVGLGSDTGAKYPSELSGGMTKRAAMARALAMDPLILFLDEPTSGLDPISADGFDKLIQKLNQSLRVTVVMVTHDLNSLFNICDRVAIIVDKAVVVDTLPNLQKLDNPWVHEFLHGCRGEGAALAAKHKGGKRDGNR